MRVLFISTGLAPQFGGAPISEANLAKGLSRHLDVQVICPKGRLDPAFALGHGLEGVVEVEPNQVLDLWSGGARELGDLLRSVDLIHLNGHWRWENHFWARIAVAKGVPLFLHPRGMLWVGHRKVIRKRLFNRLLGNYIVSMASRVVALSHFETRQFAPYGLDSRRVVVIPNGVDVPAGAPNADRAGFLYFGRIEARKNLPFLLESFGAYRKLGGTGGLRLMGPVERGHDRELHALGQRLGLGGHFQILPPEYGPGKLTRIRQSWAVIYPTQEEPFGRVPFESFAAGVPCLVPEASGAAEYLRSHAPSVLYPGDDREALAQAMKRLELSAGELPQQGLQRVRDWIARDLQWDHLTQTVLSHYDQALSRSSPPARGRPTKAVG